MSDNLKVQESPEYKRYFENESFSEAFSDYWEWRKKKKMPVTDRVMRNLMKKADQYGNGNIERATAVIDQSLENGWQSFYPLKDNVLPTPFGKSRRRL